MSEIILSKENYFHNLEQIAQKVGSKDKIMLVLKDNAYGHGAVLLASAAREFGIKFACTRTESEAFEISEFFDEILVLSHLANANENPNFTYAINSLEALKSTKNGTKVHLAIDTMMHRNGILPCEIREAFEIANLKNIQICGVYTHFRSADEPDSSYFIQREIFKKIKLEVTEICQNQRLKTPIFHSHNSAAFERVQIDEIKDEFVRIGLLQYGYNAFYNSLNLKPVLRLYADKISSRVLKKGQKVGYGGVFTAQNDTEISTYDLGYADGLFRYDAKFEFKFKDFSMLGRMSMDSFSANSSKNRLCVLDNADFWASKFNTISYEILAKLSPNIKRRFG